MQWVLGSKLFVDGYLQCFNFFSYSNIFSIIYKSSMCNVICTYLYSTIADFKKNPNNYWLLIFNDRRLIFKSCLTRLHYPLLTQRSWVELFVQLRLNSSKIVGLSRNIVFKHFNYGKWNCWTPTKQNSG